MLRPKPVPTPVGLVVKNGSNARSRTSRVMPLPESLMADEHILSMRDVTGMFDDIILIEIGVGGLDRQPPAFRHGIARIDREIEERVFKLVGIDRGFPEAAAKNGFDGDGLADGPAQQFRHALDQPVDID